MQTVNFQCGHCGNLMAVGAEHLGQQVRCPTCQQVVVAPRADGLAPAEGPTEPILPAPPAHDHEDIFTPPDAGGDDLFGTPNVPRLEIPPGPSTAAPANGSPPADSAGMPTLTYHSPNPSAPTPGDATATAFPDAPSPTWMEPTLPETPPAGPPARPPAEDLAAVPRPARRSARGGGWFVPLVFMPLVLYSLLISVLAYQLYRKTQEKPPRNFFEMIPEDENGDGPPAKKAKPLAVSLPIDEKFATSPLPEDLRTRLGKPIVVGDLEVTPEKVERRRVAVYVAGSERPQECEDDSLVLHLRLRNVSTDVVFAPVDNFFDRQYRNRGKPPLTALQVGDRTFFGGPAEWYPPRGPKSRDRQWIADPGRTNYPARLLKPGQEMKTIVCTDGGTVEWNPRVVQYVEQYGNGPLLWRVHLRRGLVPFRGREVSATAVIGVEFTGKDIQKPARAS